MSYHEQERQDLSGMKNVNRRGIGKRILAALLCAMLFIGGGQPAAQPVLAAQQSTVQQSAVQTFITNNQKAEAFRFSLENGKLIISSVPSSGGYQYVMARIGENQAVFPVSDQAELDLPRKDGVYYVDIFLGKERYGTYQGVLNGEDLGIEIKNGIASFVVSPVYENNRKLYKKGSTSVTARGYYTQPSHWVESDAAEIKALAEKIVSAGDSDYEKVRKVHDWVASNIWYDYDALYSGESAEVDALKVLKLKRTVCHGYSNLTAALLRSMGIPTKVTCGYALGISTSGAWTDAIVSGDQSNHAWNEAYVDGRWVILDTTWDSGNKYEKGKFSKGTGLKNRKYFDPTLEFFSADHKILPESEYDRWERGQAFSSALSVSKESLSLKKGGTEKLAVKTSKKYIKIKDAKITYTSSNKEVASVGSKGKIKAKKAGSAVITTKVKLEGITLEFRTSVTVKD